MLNLEGIGFFVEQGGQVNDIKMEKSSNSCLHGKYGNLYFEQEHMVLEDREEIRIRIENKGDDFDGKIGFHTGVDSYMESYPQWHEKYFPTLLRCEKTHLWGYYMNTREQALAIVTQAPVASYDILYNKLPEGDGGHRILGTDIALFQNTTLPARHPQDQKILYGRQVYENRILFIPVKEKADIKKKISVYAGVPVVDAQKYTLEPGENLNFDVLYGGCYQVKVFLPDGTVLDKAGMPLSQYGLYRVLIEADNGKVCEACFFVRKSWDYYLEAAAKNALSKPPKATTHAESFYGLFSCFLDYKHTKDEQLGAVSFEAFEEVLPYMFDFEKCVPIVIPDRIQNTASLVSLLVDMYETDTDKNIKYLRSAAAFGDYLMENQGEDGAYRNKGVHYTCVIYIAKSMLELALAERKCADAKLMEKAVYHYQSVKRAVDELVKNLDNIQTEGEMTLEDGMISCSALQIGMFALTLPEKERQSYIDAAEYMMMVHACLEQQLIPDCRMNGASLRYWESQYDVMIRGNMLNSPHGWTGWTAYALYYLYLLTGKKQYLLSLMNTLGSCVQLIDENGNLRWGFCSQPYVKAKAFVPDVAKEVADGYQFVQLSEKAYRGRYEVQEFGEQYIDMISGWYRTGKQKVTGGYEFCPLIYVDWEIRDIDNQGGCCDNDVHEIFKCMEETVLKKAFIHENEDGTFLVYGCRAERNEGKLIIEYENGVNCVVCNLRRAYDMEEIKKQGLEVIECGRK